MANLIIDLGSYSTKVLFDNEDPLELILTGDPNARVVMPAKDFFSNNQSYTNFNSVVRVTKETGPSVKSLDLRRGSLDNLMRNFENQAGLLGLFADFLRNNRYIINEAMVYTPDIRKPEETINLGNLNFTKLQALVKSTCEEELSRRFGVNITKTVKVIDKKSLGLVLNYCANRYNFSLSDVNLLFAKPEYLTNITEGKDDLASVCQGLGVKSFEVKNTHELLFYLLGADSINSGLVLDLGNDSMRLKIFRLMRDPKDNQTITEIYPKITNVDTVFSLGGRSISRLIQESLIYNNLTFRDVELLKINNGLPANPNDEITRAIFDSYDRTIGINQIDFNSEKTFIPWFINTFNKMHKDPASDFIQFAEDRAFNILVCGGLTNVKGLNIKSLLGKSIKELDKDKKPYITANLVFHLKDKFAVVDGGDAYLANQEALKKKKAK